MVAVCGGRVKKHGPGGKYPVAKVIYGEQGGLVVNDVIAMGTAKPYAKSNRLSLIGLRGHSSGGWLVNKAEHEKRTILWSDPFTNPVNGFDAFGKVGLLQTLITDSDEAGSMAVQIKQGYSIISKVKDAVDAYDTIQEIAAATMQSEFGSEAGSEEMLMGFLNLGNQSMAMGIGGASKSTKKGMKMHKLFYLAAEAGGMIANQDMGNGRRPDAIDYVARIVYELKPWSKSGRRAGVKQIK